MCLGDAFAQSLVTGYTYGQMRFQWAQKSASQGERNGFHWLGICFSNGEGCERNTEKAKENFLIAAEFGHVFAMACLTDFFNKNDPQKYFWSGKAATNSGDSNQFLHQMLEQVHKFNSGYYSRHANVIFAIGRELKHVLTKRKKIFRNGPRDAFLDTFIDSANQALRFYEFQLQRYRKAVDDWTIIGLRNKVVKDIRKMIGLMIWNSREDAIYIQ